MLARILVCESHVTAKTWRKPWEHQGTAQPANAKLATDACFAWQADVGRCAEKVRVFAFPYFVQIDEKKVASDVVNVLLLHSGHDVCD